MKDPAFLFYSGDFFTGVSTMSFEDRGKFITILCLMHQKGRMDEETIRFLVGSVSDNLKSKFLTDEKSLWYNERLEFEIEKRRLFTESRRNNGSLGGRPKKEEEPKLNLEETDRLLVAKPNDNLMENENRIENIDKNKGVKPKKELPTLDEFLDYAKTLEIYKPELDYSIKAKYKTWVDAKWHDGNGKEIKIWKNTLANTLPFLKPINNSTTLFNQQSIKSTVKDI